VFNWKAKPIYTDNLFGKGGKKYVAGGMIIRECKNWMVLVDDIGEGELAYKVASNEHRAFNNIRGAIEGIEVPMTCLINYYGIGYFV